MASSHVVREESDHMSAVNIHTEGQRLVGSILASGSGGEGLRKALASKG